MTPNALLIIFTALDLTLIVLLIGLYVTERWLLPVGLGIVGQQRMERQLLVFLSINTCLLLLSRASEICQCKWTTLASLLPTILTQTHFGQIALLRLVTLFLWLITLAIGRPKSRLWHLIGLAILVFTVSAVSHAASAGDFSWRELVGVLHLLFGATWLGSLIIVTLAVIPEAARLSHALMMQLLHRLSRLALLAVLGVVMTGIYQSYSVVRPLNMLWTHLYGWILTAKLSVIVVMILLGGANRLLFIPMWVTNPSAASWLNIHRTLLVETLLAPLVICLAAALMNTMPPMMT